MNALIYWHVSFIVRMLIIFTSMMKFYHWVDKKSVLWKITKRPFKIIAGIFYIADILYNWYSSIYFLELPKVYNETISYRCSRYMITEKDKNNIVSKWRYTFARFICWSTSLSDPNHCGLNS